MPVALDALIKRTKAAIAAEADPKKRSALETRLVAYSVAKADSDGDDDGPPEKKDGDDDGGDDEAAKHAENARKMKAKAKAMGHRAKAAEHKQKAAESEEEAKKCEEEASGADEDDEEAKAMLDAATRAALGTHPAAVSAAPGADPTVVALVRAVADLTAQTTKIRADGETAERASLMTRAGRYIPKHILKPIAASANLATLRAMVTEAEKGQPMVSTEEGDLIRPKHVDPETEAALPAATLAIIDEAVTNCGAKDPKAFRAALVTAHLAASKAGTNGVRGKGAY